MICKGWIWDTDAFRNIIFLIPDRVFPGMITLILSLFFVTHFWLLRSVFETRDSSPAKPWWIYKPIGLSFWFWWEMSPPSAFHSVIREKAAASVTAHVLQKKPDTPVEVSTLSFVPVSTELQLAAQEQRGAASFCSPKTSNFLEEDININNCCSG